MIKIRSKGSFKNTERFFENSKQINNKFRQVMERYGRSGVEALQKATPINSGETANSWYYRVENWGLTFLNSNIVNGVPIAIIIQYGHGTRYGGYVSGIDYINPALKPIFEKIKTELDKEVINL